VKLDDEAREALDRLTRETGASEGGVIRNLLKAHDVNGVSAMREHVRELHRLVGLG
jgi:hypothetical protein